MNAALGRKKVGFEISAVNHPGSPRLLAGVRTLLSEGFFDLCHLQRPVGVSSPV